MNKIVCLFFNVCLFYGMNVHAQIGAVVNVSVNIIGPLKSAQLKCANSFLQIVPNSNIILGNPIILLSENGKLIDSTIKNLASFSSTSENENSFSVTLPQPSLILKNTKKYKYLSG